MIGVIDRQVRLTIVYAPNDRHEEAHRVVKLASGEQARFCNPKYWETSGCEPDARKVWILPNSPNLNAILAAYAEAGIPAQVAGAVESPPPAAPPPAEPEPAPSAPADDLPPWESKRITPGQYVGRYPAATTAKAELARRYVEAGRPEG